MVDKLVPNNDKQKYPFCRLKLVVKNVGQKLDKPTNQNSKVPKVAKPSNKKTLL